MTTSPLERKVYSTWAFDKQGAEKAKINREIYEELKPKIRFLTYQERPTEDDLNTYTYIERAGDGYGHKSYRILSNPHNLSQAELALCCDKGNLCFGYRASVNRIIINTD